MPNAAEITLNDVFPWGRSFAEYRAMFRLSEDDLRIRILGCADGPASFNAELTRRGGCVISCDPLYRFSSDEIRQRIAASRDRLVESAAQNRDRFLWKDISSPEELGQRRTAAMEIFLADYEAGTIAGRYLPSSLPELSLEGSMFDLALCSHFLFLYTHVFSLEFHCRGIAGMCRRAEEARVFPLLDMNGELSEHVEGVMGYLGLNGYVAKIEPVDYEFVRGGNQMLRVRRGR